MNLFVPSKGQTDDLAASQELELVVKVSHNLCTTTVTNWSRNHMECDSNTQDLSQGAIELLVLYDRPRSVGLTDVFIEYDCGKILLMCCCTGSYLLLNLKS